MDAVLKENTYISDLEEALKVKEPAVKEKEQLLERVNDLLLLLKKKEIDPDNELM